MNGAQASASPRAQQAPATHQHAILAFSAAAIFVVAFLAACTGTSSAPSPMPTVAPQPTSAAQICPSVLNDEGGDPPPIAPSEALAPLAVVVRVDLPVESVFVAASPGAIWATSPAGVLWRIDPATGLVADTVELPELGLARPAYGHGSLWVAEMASGRLLRLDPTTGAIQAEIQLDVADRPIAIAFSPLDVWIANPTANEVTVIDPVTNTVKAAFDLSDAGGDPAPASVATGEDVTWVVEHRADTLAAIDPATGTVTRTCIGSPDPGTIAVAGGWLWVADSGGVVSVLDPSSGLAQVRLGLPAVTGGELANDGDLVWVAGGSSLVGIDVGTRQVVAVGALGELSAERDFPGGVSVAVHDDLWTTDPGSFGLLRVTRTPAP